MPTAMYLRLLMVCFASAMPPCHAEEPAAAGECSVKARSEAVVVMVCPGSVGPDTWRMAGEAACGSKRRCNAWIWSEARDAPDVAPKQDADFAKRDTGKAAAVWVSDSKSLVSLKKVDTKK